MSERTPSGALRDIGTLYRDGMLGGLTDRQLLGRFVKRGDSSAEDAFTVLLERHGPMVWGVCRRHLRDRSAAADAFQATFLVLVRKASAVKVTDSLGLWLYGVSRRVAARARANSLRRRTREIAGIEVAAHAAPDSDDVELLAILDEEIGRLPDRHRAAVVLCDLEGLPHVEAARRLGCPVGTIESRLSRGRQRLRERLVRRGLAPGTVAPWAGTARDASAAMPAALIKQSAQFVTSSLAAGTVPSTINSLAQGVIQTMWFARLTPLAAVGGFVILATAGVAVHGRQDPNPEGAPKPAKTATAPTPTLGSKLPGASVAAANQALYKEQLAIVDRRLDNAWKLIQAHRLSFSDSTLYLWEHRRLDILRKSGASKAEIVAALEKYLDHAKQWEAWTEDRKQKAQGTELAVEEARFHRLEAEIWLNEEKAR
jgi:RNA polymerase sigma-70 factor (ECF subfamily)